MEPAPHDAPVRLEEYAQDALDSLPADLRAGMSNVEIVVEDEPPPGQPLLGLYQGVPLTVRSSSALLMPDLITLFQEPLERDFPGLDQLRVQVRRTLLHEIAHFFGISDARLRELDAY